MLIVGLTGGIGSGKSTAARYFADLGAPVVDADLIARELVAPGRPALAEIVREFGPSMLDDGGQLRREPLRRIVFADPRRRKALEAILHPRIRETMLRRLARLGGPYCIAVVPLLVETGQADLVQRVLVIDVSPSTQLARVRRRDGTPDGEIAAVIRSQAGREERLAAADDVISNEGDREELQRAVAERHRFYTALGGDSSVK